LAQHGQAHVLGAVAPFWRHTTAPYGPLFLWIVSAFAGSSLVVGVLLIRALELVGFVLLAVFVPRLARALRADDGRAAWWVLLSPLVLLELVAAAHNDLLMIGLLVAGVALAVEGRTLVAVAVCALAATIKLPAAVAIPFILMAYADRRLWVRGALVAVGAVVAITLASGLGFGWISSSIFSTPAKVRLAITPATALGWSAAQILPVGARGLESALGVVAFALAVALGVALLWRTRRDDVVQHLGIVMLAAAVCGPATWPWYLIWGLALLAVSPEGQASRVMALAMVLSPLVVKADGVLAFPLHTAPAFVVLYIAIAAVALRRRPTATAPRLRPIAES
ncbi:MAG: polyprenol phosphomannose-dependent alpha 1,6 mannosyltransferase MptB, partial [Solirubrobacterales bacterium]|nr:polyprenol phosphomannose-dependent alpha 1,6 mannosyltransferase MptB [Solirubrobacterales bacterium]